MKGELHPSKKSFVRRTFLHVDDSVETICFFFVWVFVWVKERDGEGGLAFCVFVAFGTGFAHAWASPFRPQKRLERMPRSVASTLAQSYSYNTYVMSASPHAFRRFSLSRSPPAAVDAVSVSYTHLTLPTTPYV